MLLAGSLATMLTFGMGVATPIVAIASDGGDEPRIEVRLEEGVNEVELEGAMVTGVDTDMGKFTVSVLGHEFTVKTTADTEIKDAEGNDIMVSGLMVGDIVEVEGSFDMHHKIIADEVEVGEAEEVELDEDNEDEDEDD